MALAETLRDSFNTNTTGQWSSFSTGTKTFANDSYMHTTDGVNGDYGSSQSTASYDLTSSYFFVQLVSIGSGAANTDCQPLIAQIDVQNLLNLSVNNGVIQCFKKVTNVQTQVGSNLTYDPKVHRWFRLRESGGNTFWDYSTDSNIWVNITSTANPIAVTALFIGMGGGQFGVVAATTFIFDNFNVKSNARLGARLRPHPFSPGLAR